MTTARNVKWPLTLCATAAITLVAAFTPFGGGPQAHASGTPLGTKALFSVVEKLSFGNCGPGASIDALNKSSIFLTGTFSCGPAPAADLVRVDRDNLRVIARVLLPAVTSVAYGDNALWWATGAPLGNAGTSATPGHGRLLLRVNPTDLKVTGRFTLPGPTELVTVVRGNVWVATSTSLFRLNPTNGDILSTIHLDFFPTALAGSYNGVWLYALGDTRSRSHQHLVMTVYASASGHLLGTIENPNYSYGPFAVVRAGVWVPVQSTVTQSTTVRLFEGRNFTPSSAPRGFTFDTNAYVGNGILWLIDAGGVGPTVCASPANGAVRARGGAVGAEFGAMAFQDGSTYLLRTSGLNQSLLQIAPSKRCSQ